MSSATFSVIFYAISLSCNQSSLKRPVIVNWSACYILLVLMAIQRRLLIVWYMIEFSQWPVQHSNSQII